MRKIISKLRKIETKFQQVCLKYNYCYTLRFNWTMKPGLNNIAIINMIKLKNTVLILSLKYFPYLHVHHQPLKIFFNSIQRNYR